MSEKNAKGLLVLMLSVIILFSFAACGATELIGGDAASERNRKYVDITDAVAVTFKGFNGAGEATINPDWDYLNNVYDTSEIRTFVTEEAPSFGYDYYNYGDMVTFADFISFEFDREYSNLKNGDKVTVRVVEDSSLSDYGLNLEKVKDGLGIKFQETFEFTVSGLVDGVEVDLLSDLVQYVEYVTYHSAVACPAVNGYGFPKLVLPDTYSKECNGFYITVNSGRIRIVYNNENILTFSPVFLTPQGKESIITSDWHLKQGDVITLSCKGFESYLEKHGAFFKDTEIAVTVPALGEYVVSADSISSEELEKMKSDVYAHASDGAGSDESYEMISVYAGNIKPSSVKDNNSGFKLYFVVKRSLADFWNGGYIIKYRIYSIEDIVIKPDGTKDYVVGRYYSKEKRELADIENYLTVECDYNCTKIA